MAVKVTVQNGQYKPKDCVATTYAAGEKCPSSTNLFLRKTSDILQEESTESMQSTQ